MGKIIAISIVAVIISLVIFGLISTIESREETARLETVTKSYEKLSNEFATKLTNFATNQNDKSNLLFLGVMFFGLAAIVGVCFCANLLYKSNQNQNQIRLILPENNSGQIRFVPMYNGFQNSNLKLLQDKET